MGYVQKFLVSHFHDISMASPLEGWVKFQKKCLKGDAGTSQHSLLVVMVFMLLFNDYSLPLMFYVVGIVGQFCPEFSLHCLVSDEGENCLG